MIRNLLIILFCLVQFVSQSQTVKAYVVNDKKIKLTNIKVEDSYKGNKDSYIITTNKVLYLDVDHKYRFSKAGYYAKTYYLSTSDYFDDTTLYSSPVNIYLNEYVEVKHTVISESGRPIPGVVIECKQNKFRTVTDVNGTYNMPQSSTSSAVFKFIKTGFYEKKLTFSKLKGMEEVSLEHLSSQKTQINGKVILENGRGVRNTTIYAFVGEKLLLNDRRTIKVATTNEKGYFSYVHSIRDIKAKEKLGVHLKEYIGVAVLNNKLSRQNIKIIVKKEKVSKVRKSQPKTIEKKVVVKKNESRSKADFKSVNVDIEKKEGLPQPTKIAIQQQIINDSLNVVIEEHVDTAKTGTEKELVQIEDYISYLEIMLEESNIEYGQSNKITSKQSSVKTKGTKQKFKTLKVTVDEKEVEQKEIEEENNYLWLIVLGLILVLIPVIIMVVSYVNHIKIKNVNLALNSTNKELTLTYNRIKNSIKYAKRIQESVLVHPNTIKESFKDSFLFYRPKDIVSGDFYWFTKIGNKIILSAIDCTGHGVPGAFMTILSNSFLNEIVNIQSITNPKEILEHLNEKINSTLSEGENKMSDGMDLSIICIDKDKNKLEFAGANNPLFFVEGDEIKEIKGSRRGVGGQERVTRKGKIRVQPDFEYHEMDLDTISKLYLFSDGLPDQFGGPDEEKFLKSTFRKLMESNLDQTFDKQGEILAKSIDSWKGNLEQTDDMIVIGIKI